LPKFEIHEHPLQASLRDLRRPPGTLSLNAFPPCSEMFRARMQL
jgi:hypothetical protein